MAFLSVITFNAISLIIRDIEINVIYLWFNSGKLTLHVHITESRRMDMLWYCIQMAEKQNICGRTGSCFVKNDIHVLVVLKRNIIESERT